jgi:hypothetical protein
MVRWSEDELRAFKKKYKQDMDASAEKMKAMENVKKPEGVPLIRLLAQDRPDDMNKLERAFYGHLIRTTNYVILCQSVKLRMADKTWYSPDFFCLCEDGIARVFETKGFMRDDAAVKLKTTAEMYPYFRFYLVTKKKGGVWDIRPVPPHKEILEL